MNVAMAYRADSTVVRCPSCSSEVGRHLMRVGTHQIMRCETCDLRYSSGTVDAGPASALYDALYEETGLYQMHVQKGADLANSRLPPIERAKRTALDILRSRGAQRLLEIGCGNGTFLAYASQIANLRAHGIDVSANALEIARSHLKCPLHCGVLDASAYPNERFDAICAWEVFEHVPEPRQWLRSIHERLEPGGLVMLSTPNYGSRWMWRDMPADPRSRPPVHLTFWNKPSIEQALQAAGFINTQVRMLSIPASAARRSGTRMERWLVYPDALLRESQRSTMLVVASRPANQT